MIIEFHSSYPGVSESLVDTIKERMLLFYHIQKHISRIEIYLRDDLSLLKKDRVCEIRLTLPGDSIFLHRRADSFEKAAAEAMDELEKQLLEQAAHKDELPEEVTTTVRV